MIPANVLSTLHQHLDALLLQYGDAPFTSGGCAALALGAYAFLRHHAPQSDAGFSVIYRIERDEDTDEELDRVLSHVALACGDTLDIGGGDAVDRWCTRIADTMTPWHDDAYNDIEVVELDGSEAPLLLLTHCAQYGISFDLLHAVLPAMGVTLPEPWREALAKTSTV